MPIFSIKLIDFPKKEKKIIWKYYRIIGKESLFIFILSQNMVEKIEIELRDGFNINRSKCLKIYISEVFVLKALQFLKKYYFVMKNIFFIFVT